MKIESLARRPGGTKIEMGGVTYHFAPTEDGRHVAEVDHIPHIKRFLEIPEGFAGAEGEIVPAGAEPEVDTEKGQLQATVSTLQSQVIVLKKDKDSLTAELAAAKQEISDLKVAALDQRDALAAALDAKETAEKALAADKASSEEAKDAPASPTQGAEGKTREDLLEEYKKANDGNTPTGYTATREGLLKALGYV